MERVPADKRGLYKNNVRCTAERLEGFGNDTGCYIQKE